MNRRSFMQAILAASVAPAVVRAASLMRVRVTDGGIALPTHDDALWVRNGPDEPFVLVARWNRRLTQDEVQAVRELGPWAAPIGLVFPL